MKKITTTALIQVFSVAALLFATASCKKENSLSTDEMTSTSDIQAAVASTQAIAIAAGTAAGDSVYIVNTCGAHQKRDSISFSSLPATISTYLSANYAGYTAQKAFAVKDASGTVNGYIAIIQFNGNPVGVKFDASGNFISVLEQREGRDLRGRGWHEGGRFEHRNGLHKDTIALSSLPASIKTYLTANYATDTLLGAFRNRDSAYIIISKNSGMYANVFSASGTFIGRTQLPSRDGKAVAIAEASLPSNIQTYLSSTYPGYVFSKAFSVGTAGSVQGYVVVIEANNTRYAVLFDAAGNFVKAKAIH